MKKLLGILLAAAVLFSLAACGRQEDDRPEETTGESNSLTQWLKKDTVAVVPAPSVQITPSETELP